MNKKSFLKHTALAFVVRIFGAFSVFFMNLVIARSLSVEQSGLFFLAFAITSALGMLCTLGLTNAFIRFIGGFHSEGNWPVIKGVFIIGLKRVLLVSVCVATLLFVFAETVSATIFNKPDLTPILQIIALAIPCFAIYQIVGFAYQGVHKPLPSIIFQNITNQLIVTFVIILFMVLGFSLTGEDVSKVFFVGAFLTCVAALWFWLRQKSLKVSTDFSQTSFLVASAKPLWLMMLMIMMVQYSGQVITGIYVSSEGVALFSVAQRVAMLTSFVLVAVNLVAAPRFAASAKQNKPEELRATSLFCSRIMVVLATPVLIFMLVFPEFILGFFGDEYKKAAFILQILVLGQFVNVITGSVGFLLNMTGHERDMRNVVFLSGPMAITLCLVLTPLYGATGAAVGTAIALASQNLLAVYMVKKRLGFNTLNLIRQ